MKLLIFSDIDSPIVLPESTPDVVLLLGDIDKELLIKIDQKYNCKKFGVLGNTDNFDSFSGTSIINLHEQIETYKGVSFAGFGGIPKYNSSKDNHQYNEMTAGLFTDFLDYVDVFIAHSNPMWNYTSEELDPYRGFYAFVDYIERKQPKYFFHGHLHKKNEKRIGKTLVQCIYRTMEIDI